MNKSSGGPLLSKESKVIMVCCLQTGQQSELNPSKVEISFRSFLSGTRYTLSKAGKRANFHSPAIIELSMNMGDEDKIDRLFRETYKQVALNYKDYCTKTWGHEAFYKYDGFADKLVSLGLVSFTDNDKTRICVTEKGEKIGKESSYIDLVTIEKEKITKEVMKEEIRTELDKVNLLIAKKQLKTFWLTFLIALISLIVSLIAIFK